MGTQNSPTFLRRKQNGNGMFIAVLGFASCLTFIYMSFGDLRFNFTKEVSSLSFVKRNGTRFTLDGEVFYVHGWNSYWLMDHAVDEYSRPRVRGMLQAGAKMGLTVCRTWAFNDGGYNALQISPGRFDERVFKALDHVIAEARKQGVRLILSLVNNLRPYGGKTQYVNWAWEEGVGLSSSNDSFFYDPSIRNYFKNYIKTMLTRKNSITGIDYRNDPTILAWELINEPRCMSDASGDTLQDWIEEMSAYVKSIDSNHLVTVGLEGFYGPNNAKRLTVNPEQWASALGTDFIRNSNVSNIDFASVHVYPDNWFQDQGFEENLKFLTKWMHSHIEDGDEVLNKPVLFAEYGLSNESKNFEPSHRDKFFKTVLDIVYKSATQNQSGAGSLVWQFIVEGMEESNDDFGMVPWKLQSTYRLFTKQSCRLAALHGQIIHKNNLQELCLWRY